MAASPPSVGAFGPVRFPVYAPSAGDAEQADGGEAVGEEPALMHVHGFHAAARPSAIFLSERRAAFAAGVLVAAMDLDNWRQDFVYGHTDAVTCLGHSAEQGLGASGQVRRAGGKVAEVLLWSSDTMKVVATFKFHQSDIVALGFIQGGEVLVTIGSDRDHTLALWATAQDGWYSFRKREKVPLVVSSAYKGGGVHGVLAAPGGIDKPPRFVTYGAAHLKFWQSDRFAPSKLEGRRGSFSAEGAPRAVVCVAWMSREKLVVGGSEGEVYFFEGTRVVRRVQPHRLPVAVLMPLPDAVLAVTSKGVCYLVREGAQQPPRRMAEIEVSSLPGAPDPRMQTPIVGGATFRRSSILLASRTYLLCLDVGGGLHQPRSCSVLLMQPSKALTTSCAHPSEPRIFTGALDGGVRCYRTDSHQPLPERSFRGSGGVTCLAVSDCPSGAGTSAWLAVGCDDSTLSILTEGSFRYVLRRCLSAAGAKLTCARFSASDPSGVHPLWLGVGTSDGCIHTFRFKQTSCASLAHSGAEAVEKIATMRGHSAEVIDIAFANELPCKHLLSVDSSGQSLAFDVPMARRLPSVSAVRDLQFSPWTSPVGWHVLGCWSPQKAVDSAALPPRRFCEVRGRGVIAATDAETARGIELFPFPCPSPPFARPLRLRGPAAPVSALLHNAYSDCLGAASDTVLFVWSWARQPSEDASWSGPPAASAAAASPSGLRPAPQASPARPLRGSVLFDTPEGPRRAIAAARALSSPAIGGGAAFTPPPRGRAPGRRLGRAKENMPNGKAVDRLGRKEQRTPSPHKAWAATAPLPPPDDLADADSLAEAELQESPGLGGSAPPTPLLDTEEADAPTPEEELAETQPRAAAGVRWSLAPPPVASPLSPADTVQERPRPHGRSRSLVAPKVGAQEGGDSAQNASSTQRVREENNARARIIHDRHRLDMVGMILGGREFQSAASLSVPPGTYSESSSGRWLCRSRDETSRGGLCEVEVQLPGGRLLRVLRNPLRRTLTFEGEVVNQWALGGRQDRQRLEERLVLQLPVGCDLAQPPQTVERAFEEGRCLVAVCQASSGAAGVPCGAGSPASGRRRMLSATAHLEAEL